MPDNTHKITNLLMARQAGTPEATEELMKLVYSELRELARAYMHRERPGHTLQATALVHEVYIRLWGTEPIDWKNSGHFFAVAAQQMRRVLVDHARAVKSAKRWGALTKISLGDVKSTEREQSADVIALDEALQRLEAMDARAAKVVELRYFGGLSEQEAATVLSISIATLKRDWKFARTWLVSELS